MAQWRTPLSLLLLAASIPVAAGCGGGNGSSSAETTPATTSAAAGPALASAKVTMANFAFDPTPVTVKAGGTVTWTNTDSAPHTATADDQKTFDTGTLDKAKSKTITLSKPGTYTYVCRFHPFMHGTVVVQ